jgi:polygalacturonase
VAFYTAQAQPVIISGHHGWWVEAPLHLRSELGNVLAQKNGTFGLVAAEQDGMLAATLRSVGTFCVKGVKG